MDYNVQIDFQLLGTTVLPNDITQMIGVTPEMAFLKGMRNPKLGLPRTNIWSIRSHASSDKLADHWDDLAIKLENSTEIIKEIASTGTAKLTLIINSSDRIPSLIIPPEMSRFAGYIGAVIDIDHYA